MSRETIKQILIRRDGLTANEADNLITEAHAEFDYYISANDFDAAERICEEFFGLEPDYLDEFF